MTTLQDLYDRGGQSPWIDNLKRSYITSGRLAELISDGIRGLTSNPTIMAKAIAAGNDYDEQFDEATRRHSDVLSAYWDLVVKDVTDALDLFAPLYEESRRGDGFVSIEVAPALARDTDGTIAAARDLHERIGRPNVLVKIPATEEGLPAIRRMISEGRSINVTLIFSIERYEEVIEAYIAGLEELVIGGGDPSAVASVASFFVSRVDTETDQRLEAVAAADPGSEVAAQALALRGKAAVAQARLAYETFERRFSGPRWEQLVADERRTCNGRSGLRRRRRTRPTRTSPTWIPSWRRTRSTPCRRRRSRKRWTTASCRSWAHESSRTRSRSSRTSPPSAWTSRTWPGCSKTRVSHRSRSPSTS